MQLNARAELLLKTLIERYIAEGEPIGSRTLARHVGLDLSPATIRNVMVDLEELGLVSSPHTSAGRIPTQRGYRLFVDTLLRVRPLDEQQVRAMKEELASDHDPQQLIENASHLLSEITRLAGIVLVPHRDEQLTFRHIDFLSLAGQRILVILVTHDGRVDNRIVTADRDYLPAELEQAAKYFNESYAGKRLADIKRALVREMQEVGTDLQRIADLAVEMARKAFAAEKEQTDELVVSGESNLMGVPDLGDISKLRKLFDAIAAKRDLLHLLDQSMNTSGIKIFIGAESGYSALEDCSVVTASYNVDQRRVGTLGVIGPTRMPYEHIIPIVDITARLLSAAMSAQSGAVGSPPRLESSAS
ncbi:MAG: heat-inducible transcriptional repressor HrcA [Sulfurifustis sp.]